MTLLDGVGEIDRPWPWLDTGLIAVLLGLCAVIAIIDWRRRIIPDVCNAAVGLLGLLYASFGGTDAIIWAMAQGATIFACFWLVRRLYKAVRQVQGLGLGDVKFLGAAGVWIGLQGIAPLMLVACTAALVWLGAQMLRGSAVSARHALPFGPFLAFGLVVVFGVSLGSPS